MMDYIKILTSSSIIINRAVFLLDQKKIQTHIKDNVESARLAGFGAPQNDVELYVHKSEFEYAKNIIENSNIANEL